MNNWDDSVDLMTVLMGEDIFTSQRTTIHSESTTISSSSEEEITGDFVMEHFEKNLDKKKEKTVKVASFHAFTRYMITQYRSSSDQYYSRGWRSNIHWTYHSLFFFSEESHWEREERTEDIRKQEFEVNFRHNFSKKFCISVVRRKMTRRFSSSWQLNFRLRRKLRV